MRKLTASFLGRDCPGIVAIISRLFGELGCNIEAMSQTMLNGEFAAIFVVDAPDDRDAEYLKKYLSDAFARENVDLSVIARPAISGKWGENLKCEPFVVTVDGPDGPGLIGALSRVFARHDVNIENLTAILDGQEEGSALFVFEAMVPESVDLGRLRRELNNEATKLNLRVSVQHRKIFEAIHRLDAI
ncbi:MAG: ACT domain-containing protein [Desulfovibrio sp.]|nr:ACT domain-containing protein [Desulfovibrio sp.]